MCIRDSISSYENDIKSYVKEMFSLWVPGESDVEADWETYLKTLEQMGVQEYISAYQAYYDRVMKK